MRHGEQLVEYGRNRRGVDLGDRGRCVALAALRSRPAFDHDLAVVLSLAQESPTGSDLDGDESSAGQLPLVNPLRVACALSHHRHLQSTQEKHGMSVPNSCRAPAHSP